MNTSNAKRKIPVYEPVLGKAVRDNVLECIDSNWISSRGPFIEKFEREYADFVGARHAVSVSNGTVAIHLAMLALGIGPGDEVIVPTFTYIASVNAIAYVGATPVFVDSELESWQLDPEDVRQKISARTRAIMAVHLYGQPADMDALCTIAGKYGIPVVEDCAEAIGSRINGRHVGTMGAVATWSFFGNKTITTGEGGMVTTDSDALESLVRKLKGQGLSGTREYWHDVVGYNYRMTNICAAIGVGQLPLAGQFLKRKRQIAEAYHAGLTDVPVTMLWEREGTTNSFWMNCIAVRSLEQRDPLRKALANAGVETRPGFYPAHTMPMYSIHDHGPYPNATHIAQTAINLPSSPALSDADIDYVVQQIRAHFSA